MKVYTVLAILVVFFALVSTSTKDNKLKSYHFSFRTFKFFKNVVDAKNCNCPCQPSYEIGIVDEFTVFSSCACCNPQGPINPITEPTPVQTAPTGGPIQWTDAPVTPTRRGPYVPITDIY